MKILLLLIVLLAFAGIICFSQYGHGSITTPVLLLSILVLVCTHPRDLLR